MRRFSIFDIPVPFSSVACFCSKLVTLDNFTRIEPRALGPMQFDNNSILYK
jgi:hypothetical protein